MSLMFLTDLHLDNYRPFSKILANGMNTRLLDQFDVIRKVASCIENEHPEAVLFLGDMFNGTTESLPKIIYNAGFLTVQAWSKVAPLYILVGNHDIYRGMHVLSTFETLPNVHIISHTTKIKLGNYEVDLIPWGDTPPEERGDICAGHLEVYGAMMDAAYACKGGIQPTSFFGYKYVLLGHFHNPQDFVVPGCQCARYIGSIMQTDRRRSSEGLMGITMLENDGTLKSFPISSPRIYDVVLDTEEAMEKFIQEILDPENYFKVTITNASLNFPSDLDRVSVEYDLPAISTSRLIMPENAGGTWNELLATAVELYIDQTNTVLDKKTLKTLAKELL